MKNDPVIRQFSRILQNKPNVDTSNQGQSILSYRFPVLDKDFDRTVNSLLKTNKTAFYFEKPGEDVRFLAVGKILSVRSSGSSRFDDLANTYSKIRPLIVHHYNGASDVPFPLFVGSMSFFPEHRDSMWRDFHPSDWFIPEFIVAKSTDGCRAAYQIDLNKDAGDEQSILRLEEFLSGLPADNPEISDNPPDYRTGNEEADKNGWMEKVAVIVESIRRGEVNKVVLSRHITIEGVEGNRILKEITKTGKSFQDCYIFVFKSGSSLFMGISPEKLASFSGDTVYCDAIAGSIGRGRTGEEDGRLGNELLSSRKNRDEHQIVVNHIKSILNRYCSSVDMDRLPILKKLSYIQHLYTGVRGVLHPGVSIFRVLEDLHPTPAVGGYPLSPALKMIQSMEQYDRGLYTGYLGWFDTGGNGDFCVALRSALLIDNTLHAFAGGGIVADSKPEDEYRETEIKLKAITSLLHP